VTGERFWPHDEQLLRSVMDWSWRRITGGQNPQARARPSTELDAALGDTVVPDGIGGHEALHLFTQVVVPATRAQDNPMNLAFVPAAPTEAALVFDLAVSAAEMFAGTWEAGAGAIAAENQALAWLASLAGWPATAGGCFVSGATMGNLSALVASRERARTRLDGAAPPRWRFAATGDAHSSVRAAATVMDCEVLAVPGDERGRMTGTALAEVLATLGPDPVAEGLFAVVVSSGTTNAGVVDDIAGVAEVCRANGLWLHVDGAYGAAAMVAPSVAPLFAGMEHADSFVVDPHKWLFAPYDCCALVYREPEHGAAAHSQFANYLEGVDRTVWNPADFAVHLTRRARGLPFWFSLATYGTDRYRDAVETVLATTRAVADEIRSRPHLRLVMEPDLSVVLFERVGWESADYEAWSDYHARAGNVLCVPTRWEDRSMLRFCFINPTTDVDEVASVLDGLADAPPG
jgi:glutamate/tyrosine decarboxylase-like PLP-dependent enzyme